MTNFDNIGSNSKPPTLGDQSQSLYDLRPTRRDRTGEIIGDDQPAIHGATSPPIPRLTRRQRIERLSVVERTEAETAYLEAYDLAIAYPRHHAEICRAIHDAATQQGRR